MSALFVSKWLPGRNDLRNAHQIKSIGYEHRPSEKSAPDDTHQESKLGQANKSQHIIHKAIEWKRMLDDGSVRSYSEIASKEGLTMPRITQIMNLLKLPTEWKDFLKGLVDSKEIRVSAHRIRERNACRRPRSVSNLHRRWSMRHARHPGANSAGRAPMPPGSAAALPFGSRGACSAEIGHPLSERGNAGYFLSFRNCFLSQVET
jgi:hypothetical protein